MKRACVIGWPIAHSRSPLIHGYWLKRYGIEGAYTKEAIETDNVEEFLNSLAQRGYAGCNVTVPHKETAYRLAAHKDNSAIAVGAANTMWLEGEDLACANTDTYGFMTNLTHAVPDWSNREGPVVILGAGGSARAVIHGFLEAGRSDVRVFNRSPERAEALVEHFGKRVSAWPWDARNYSLADGAIVVNTTTLGMNATGQDIIQFDRVGPGSVFADLVYVPLETHFIRKARACGFAVTGGLGMLLHQAVPGFEKWFGVKPDVTVELFDLVARDIGAS